VVWTFSARSKLRRRARAANRDPDAVSADLFATGLLAGVFGVLASGTFLSALYYPVFWVLVGLMAALLRVAPPPVAKVGDALPSRKSFRDSRAGRRAAIAAPAVRGAR
jgi:hypothetical protein